ncbi:MAG: ComF family protein [Clostridia bacterium]|nr:ComF family protein [Clostridia bacterium]
MKIEDYENDETKNFDEHIYFFKYQGIIREEIIKYKFQEKSYNYKMFSSIILNDKELCKILSEYEIIIAVPVSRKRKKERGYNQTELIAKEISKKLNIQYAKNILYKTVNTVAQSKLNKEEREKNAAGVYKIKNQEEITNKKILLLDDIYTTGSTVGECSKILKQANPKKIGVFTIAKD